MAESPDALIEQVAQAMEAHRRYDGGQIGVDCECGETFREFPAYDAHDRHAARAVLEAVAPAIAANALRAAAEHASDARCGYANPRIRSVHAVTKWLRERADQIEKEDR